jgi:type IV secretory pathway TraG/TraD family ATPase VirD4
MIATWMRLAIFEAMSQAEEVDQRLWFVVDELDAIGPIDGLKDALARLRKFGGRCVLGFQSIAQVSNTYGTGDAQTIVENCGNTLILRCAGSESGGTSQFASRLIGEREIVRRQVTRGRDRETAFGAHGGRRSTSVSEQIVSEPAVLASQIEQLPDLKGYWKAASGAHWSEVDLRAAGRSARA